MKKRSGLSNKILNRYIDKAENWRTTRYQTNKEDGKSDLDDDHKLTKREKMIQIALSKSKLKEQTELNEISNFLRANYLRKAEKWVDDKQAINSRDPKIKKRLKTMTKASAGFKLSDPKAKEREEISHKARSARYTEKLVNQQIASSPAFIATPSTDAKPKKKRVSRTKPKAPPITDTMENPKLPKYNTKKYTAAKKVRTKIKESVMYMIAEGDVIPFNKKPSPSTSSSSGNNVVPFPGKKKEPEAHNRFFRALIGKDHPEYQKDHFEKFHSDKVYSDPKSKTSVLDAFLNYNYHADEHKVPPMNINTFKDLLKSKGHKIEKHNGYQYLMGTGVHSDESEDD